MLCLLNSNENRNEKIKINKLFSYKMKVWDGNRNVMRPIISEIITSIMISKTGAENQNSILEK